MLRGGNQHVHRDLPARSSIVESHEDTWFYLGLNIMLQVRSSVYRDLTIYNWHFNVRRLTVTRYAVSRAIDGDFFLFHSRKDRKKSIASVLKTWGGRWRETVLQISNVVKTLERNFLEAETPFFNILFVFLISPTDRSSFCESVSRYIDKRSRLSTINGNKLSRNQSLHKSRAMNQDPYSCE